MEVLAEIMFSIGEMFAQRLRRRIHNWQAPFHRFFKILTQYDKIKDAKGIKLDKIAQRLKIHRQTVAEASLT